MNMSGFTRPQTSLMIAFSHSTDSGVGGLCTAALLFRRLNRTRSTSFSIFLPAFSTPTHAAAAMLQMSVLRQNHASQPMCFPHAVKSQVRKQSAVTTSAPVRRMFFAFERSAASTSGGKGWLQMLPGSAGAGAGRLGSIFEGEGGRRVAVPCFGWSGSRASLSSPLSR